jgi:NAD-dependent deacetylase
MTQLPRLVDGPARRVVILTGAGISVASGLPTYRGPGGLWTADPSLAATLHAGVDPVALWHAMAPLVPAVRAAEPSLAHRAIAGYEARLAERGATVTVITQNIDGLHGRAGSQRVIELHGSLGRLRCSRAGCDLPSFAAGEYPPEPPSCPRCGAPLRPAVVLFDEPLGANEEVGAKRAMRGCDLFLAIGTSGTVSPASNLVRSAEFEGARTFLVNLTPMDPPNPAFDREILGPADEIVPALLG